MSTSLRKHLFQDDMDTDMALYSLLTPKKRRFDMSNDESPSDSFITASSQSITPCLTQAAYNGHCRKSKSVKRKALFSDEENTPSRKHLVMDKSLYKQKIMNAVHDMTNDNSLVGDGSTQHTLPTVPGKHKDLKSISTDTLRELMKSQHLSESTKYIIIDCRYPYEYNGGHIKGAINLHTKQMITKFLQNNSEVSQRAVLVFHCEFSSKRGPKLLRHFRSIDREMNAENYPLLCFPEIYLLDGGYKAFFTNNKELCFPETYTPMLDKEHSSNLRHFRSKSKSCMARISLERGKCLRF